MSLWIVIVWEMRCGIEKCKSILFKNLILAQVHNERAGFIKEYKVDELPIPILFLSSGHFIV